MTLIAFYICIFCFLYVKYYDANIVLANDYFTFTVIMGLLAIISLVQKKIRGKKL